MDGQIETHPKLINVNTGVSFGLLLLMGAGIWSILGAINSTKYEMNSRFDKVEARVLVIENARNTWGLTDQFRWSVHLQQANADGKKLMSEGLKVPEPETTK